MDTSIPDGFLTKQQVSEKYGPSVRTVTREITSLLKLRDEDRLIYLRLVTDDGKVRLGTEVTQESIDDLNHGGLKPQWFIDPQWADRRWAKHTQQSRATKPKPQSERPVEPTTGQPEEGSSPSRRSDLEAMLRERIRELEQDKQDLREEIRTKNEQIKDANERGRETNVLMRDLHRLMGEMQTRLLPAPQQSLPSTAKDTAAAVSAESIAKSKPKETQATMQPTDKQQEPRPKKPASRRKSTTTTASRRQSSTPKKNASPKSRKADTKPPAKPTSKNFPTFQRLFRSLRNR